jgi:hypothetical protein
MKYTLTKSEGIISMSGITNDYDEYKIALRIFSEFNYCY